MFRQKNKNCGGCRYWSELLAQAVGGGPLEAYCLAEDGPDGGKYTQERHHCDAYEDAFGCAIDTPGLEPDYHEKAEIISNLQYRRATVDFHK